MLAVAIAIALVAAAIYFRPRRPVDRETGLGLRVTEFKGNRPMSERVLDPVSITDAEYTVVGINPEVKTDGGAPIPATDFAWESSDSSIVAVADTYTTRDGVLVDPGPYGRVLTTPSGSGTANVRVTHVPSGNAEVLPINVGASAPGEFGLSIGTPARD